MDFIVRLGFTMEHLLARAKERDVAKPEASDEESMFEYNAKHAQAALYVELCFGRESWLRETLTMWDEALWQAGVCACAVVARGWLSFPPSRRSGGQGRSRLAGHRVAAGG